MSQRIAGVVAGAAAALCLAGQPTVASAAELDLSTGEGALAALRKITCSMQDEEPVTYWWHGYAFSRVPGEPDRRLFMVEGMNTRQCETVVDEARGEGFRMVSRELLLYKDPETGEVLREWENPWTGETVEVVHVANDPVNMRPTFPRGADGEPFRLRGMTVKGNDWWMTTTVPLFYKNPLGGEYQQYVGGIYHATEMFNFFGRLDELTSADDVSYAHVGWVRQSDWLPWMKMRGRAGLIYFHTAGKKLRRFEDLSATMLEEIRTNYPEYTTPPPVDDTRPNETSWTYFRKLMEERGGPEQGSGGH